MPLNDVGSLMDTHVSADEGHEIQGAMESLEKSVERLHRSISFLEQRLFLVLGPPAESALPVNYIQDSVSTQHSELGICIGNLVASVAGAVTAIDFINERVML